MHVQYFLYFTVLLGVCDIVVCHANTQWTKEELFAKKYLDAYSEFRANKNLVNMLKKEQTLLNDEETLIDIGKYARFECDYLNYTRGEPESVHKLQPADIDVIGALGDSISAGSGIDAIFILGSLTGYRGASWSVGGDEDLSTVVTLANILKKFRNDSGQGDVLRGYSLGTGNADRPDAHLNRAVFGNKAEDLLDQAKILVDLMKNNPNNDDNDATIMNIDFENDWKMITIFIGGNDFCDYCDNAQTKERYSTDSYIRNVKAVLDYLWQEVPRMYINMVPIFKVTVLKEVSKGRSCDFFQKLICPCAVNSEFKAEMDQLQEDYYYSIKALIDTGRYNRDNFTVVLQDVIVGFTPFVDPATGLIDKSIFAPDCFHASRKGHEILAYLLWNSIIKYPVGLKPMRYPLYQELERGNDFLYGCPTEEFPYLWTAENSVNVTESELGFNITTTTAVPTPTTTTEATAAPYVQSDTDAWIAVGSTIGTVAILAMVAVVFVHMSYGKK